MPNDKYQTGIKGDPAITQAQLQIVQGIAAEAAEFPPSVAPEVFKTLLRIHLENKQGDLIEQHKAQNPVAYNMPQLPFIGSPV